MQPLAYFAVRSLLGWLQWVERAEHAFISNALVLVAAGAAHCWAVVYALFIAIHTRAMRYEGYHEGYTEHLPVWVNWTENLAVASMGIWWAAGFSTAAIRIIDDDARGLPIDGGDVNKFIQILRSERLHDGLGLAHTLSCIGLFISIVLLCFAMGLMKGSVTACELCLCFVAIGFAIPHAVVACRRLDMSNPKKAEDAAPLPSEAAEAAAQEAAALGPQLCVILALADSPGHAYLWQNFVYFVAAIAFVAAVAACGRSPPKVGNAALPPQTGEFATCLVLDIIASVALVVCFPHLNNWHLWAMTALVVALFAATWFEGWRDLLIDLLDPLFVVRSDTDKALPGKQRETLRRVSWACCLVCGAVAMWDIMLHPVQEGLFELPDSLHLDDGLADLWDKNTMMLLRWKPGEGRGETGLLWAAAESMGLDALSLKKQAIFEEQRLLLFKYDAPKDEKRQAGATSVHSKWKASVASPKGDLEKIVDTSFPAVLNVTLCLHAHAHTEMAKAEVRHDHREKGEDAPEKINIDKPMPEDFVEIVGTASDAHDAYLAGCNWWTETLDSFYGHPDHDNLTDHDLEHSSADEEGADLA